MKNDLKLKKVEKTVHTPVLLNEVIENLSLNKNDFVVDGTLGGGGYAREICKIIGSQGFLVGLDCDEDALIRSRIKLRDCEGCYCRKKFFNQNFKDLDKVLNELKILKVQKIVFDLGLSSDQFELSERGFSFQKNEPLLMTFSKSSKNTNFTAQEILNEWDEENIADILFGYGGEKFSRRIAKEIVKVRKAKEIKTTFELVEIIKNAVPVWYRFGRKIHFATKTFQALRITVNDELSFLKEGLEKSFSFLGEGGKLAVVSFHSGEDRIVKKFMREKKNKGEGLLINKKPIVPAKEEKIDNLRSRSAKLRVIEKI